ncbi:hypothetical protein NC652_002792 [Populus alba x Populus x berolinensis]|nr:hypothetical protein NC652_002792 [Populus alba x Populus x berolinensis]
MRNWDPTRTTICEKALTLHSKSTKCFSKKLDNKVRELDYTGSGIPPFWKPEIVTPKSINSRFDDLSSFRDSKVRKSVYKRGLESQYLPCNPQEVGRKSFAEAGGKELALHSSYATDSKELNQDEATNKSIENKVIHLTR